MRVANLITTIALGMLCLGAPARADESSKLTIFTFSKPVQLPGIRLEPGRYRFELADPVEARRVIKVSNEDGTKQLAMLLSISDTMRDPAKDAIVLFGEAPAGEPDAVRTWFYPGESIGYEFIYPRDEAGAIAKRYHTSVLSKSGDKIERVNESGEPVPEHSR